MISLNDSSEIVIANEDIVDSNKIEISPRISRVATLDGSSVISNFGSSHSDRTIIITLKNVPSDAESSLRRMAINAVTVTLSNREGVFTGKIEKFTSNNGEVSISFMVQNKITAD